MRQCYLFTFEYLEYPQQLELFTNFTLLSLYVNALIQCRDGILSVSGDSIRKDDIAQLIASLCTS